MHHYFQTHTSPSANDWDLEKPALTGQLKVFSSGDKLTYVRIYHKNADGQSKMFAECPVRVDRSDPERPQAKLEYFFQSVTDSSRYFVLRMEVRYGMCIQLNTAEATMIAQVPMCTSFIQTVIASSHTSSYLVEEIQPPTFNSTKERVALVSSFVWDGLQSGMLVRH
jgi:hypothetical protein